MRLMPLVVLPVVALTLAACGSSSGGSSASQSSEPAGNALVVVSGDRFLSSFSEAVNAAGQADVLADSKAITVFAPANDAFEALPKGVAAKLLLPCNKAELTKVVRYHLVPKIIPSGGLGAGKLPTLEGSTLSVAVGGGYALVNGNSGIYTADTPATNGTVKTVHRLLVPPSVKLKSLKTKC